ncbi:hypothetical protein GS416_10375 [Rhodococcus hoagii]|nr:hypothetical protein [Prescottella equi]
MRMQLRRDPLIGSWAGYPMATRTYLIETGIETAFAVLARNVPIWSRRRRSIPASRLAAELRGDIIPNLYAGEDAEAARTAHLFKNANGSELTLRSFENSTLRPSPVRGWDFTLNGGGTSTTCGRDPRVAVGAILDARSLPIPEWIERVYRPYAQARETVLNTAVLYERGHEFYHAAARSDLLWKYDDRGNAAASSDLVNAARESIIEDLRRTLPEEVALLEATGIDLDWTLRTDVDNQVMRDLRTAGTDSYGVDTGDISAGPAGSIYVGDPNGTHVVVNRRWAQGFTSQVITIDDQVYAGVDTIRDAIAEARAQLARSPQSTEPTVETGSSNAPARDERIVDVEVEEADPSPPRVVAPVVDDTGAITFDEVDTDQEPIIATGDQDQEWVLADHLVVDHIGPAIAPPPEVDTAAAADVVEELTAASGELIVPDTEFGEPISSPCGAPATWSRSARNPAATRGSPPPPQPATPPRTPPKPSPKPRLSRRPHRRPKLPNQQSSSRNLVRARSRCRPPTSPSVPTSTSRRERRPACERTSRPHAWCSNSTSNSAPPRPRNRPYSPNGRAGARSPRSSTTDRSSSPSGPMSAPRSSIYSARRVLAGPRDHPQRALHRSGDRR